ncbi:hypothetical protein M0R36_08990 [bacterium]|jgi:hypothetical protein|nr:hypothetical protein [bacterium]
MLALKHMKTFYADDTYGKTSPDFPVPRFHLFGGIIADRGAEIAIVESIRKIKSEYTHPNLPIKWNFKDKKIQDTYKQFDHYPEYERMLEDSKKWRPAIFKMINDIPFTILVSCIEAYSCDKKGIVKLKKDLNTYCFEMVLMRAGIDAKDSGEYWQCILDWPPDQDPTPFNRGYYKLFHYGTSSADIVSHSGSLEKAGFSHSLLFASCNHSPMLQLVDMAIGAIRDHIECQIGRRGTCLGSEVVDIFYNHFRNLDGIVPKYGVSASTGNEKLVQQIENIFARRVKK